MTTLLTSFDLSTATKVGKRVYRKQILPVGSINYKGRTLNFDKQYLADLAQAFNDGAYDQVPFVFADPENRHNMDPERFRGEVKAFELTPDGLDAIIEATADGAKVIDSNPNLGVSARIVEGLAKSDGRVYPRAIQHVLATMDPRVTGMKPWQAVDLSVYNGPDEVLDLTDTTYEETSAMSKSTKDGGAGSAVVESGTGDNPKGPIDLSNLSDAEFEALLADDSLGEEDLDGDGDDEGDDDGDGDGPKEGDTATVTLNDGTEVEVEFKDGKWVAKQAASDDGDGSDPEGTGDADLSVTTTSDNDVIKQMQIDLAQERFKNERKELIRAGVPPFMVDLAEPLLASPQAAVIDLATSDEPLNATEVVRTMLTKMKGMVDVKPEIGHQVDLSAEQEDESTALLKAWDEQYG